MFSKFNIKQLAAIFGILLIIVLAVKFFDNSNNNNNSSFDSNISKFEKNEVKSFILYQKSDPETPYKIYSDNEDWIIEREGKTYTASEDLVTNILNVLSDLTVERIAANKKEHWDKYKVSDSTATHVILKDANNKELLNLYCGKFDYTQPKTQNPNQRPQGKMTSYVRLNDKKEVYAVDGYVSMAFDRDLKYMRKTVITNGSYMNWKKLSLTHPDDSSFVLEKIDNKWTMNGQAADSASVVDYLKKIQHLNSTKFYDNEVSLAPTYSIIIEGLSLENPIEINGYIIDNKPVISSSLTKNTFFNAEPDNLFKKLFQSPPKIN